METQPRQEANNEVLDQALSSITKGWGMFSLAASKIASTAGENAMKFSEIATQKASELGGAVSEKVFDMTYMTLTFNFNPDLGLVGSNAIGDYYHSPTFTRCQKYEPRG